MTQDTPAIRASDAEREQAVELIDKAYAARTRDELEGLSRDLPETPTSAAPVPKRKAPRRLVAVLSGLDRRGRWRLGSDTVAVAFLGGIDLDLRDAEIEAAESQLTVYTVLGGRRSGGRRFFAARGKRRARRHPARGAGCAEAHDSRLHVPRRGLGDDQSIALTRPAIRILVAMEGGFGFPLGGDPEDLLRGLREFAEHQAESVQEAQREQFATLTLNTAVELTAAALGQLQSSGSSDEQAIALRDAMRVLFPEAVALVSAARQGFMRERS